MADITKGEWKMRAIIGGSLGVIFFITGSIIVAWSESTPARFYGLGLWIMGVSVFAMYSNE